MTLFNKTDKKLLAQRLKDESFNRVTLSFYRYVIIENPDTFRDVLYQQWSDLNCFGRIYLAREGINAQMNVPVDHWDEFIKKLGAWKQFKDMPFKVAVDGDGKSFYKLVIKVRSKIVADGLKEDEYDVTNVGNHLDAAAFNKAMTEDDTIVVDMRNHYESEVGHFEGAILPDADTFREELPIVIEKLKGQEDKKLLMYCTGGIRCEKASAYLKHKGFKDVNQLHGGIISYARQVRELNLDNKFIGKNFVFDERLGERITDDIISECHQCGQPSDSHTNCANDDCHLLFIQCAKCAKKYKGCCTPECVKIAGLPIEEQRVLRKNRDREKNPGIYKSRLRPNLGKKISKKKK